MRDPMARLLTLDAAVAWRARFAGTGDVFAVTNGCYDILHPGHVDGLFRARRECDALLVLVNSDASVRALKGPGRPVHPEAARAMVLLSLRAVDAAVVFPGTDCAVELAALAPDLYIKSEEYRGRQHPGEAASIAACGARTVWLPRDPRWSTTAIVEAYGRGAAPATPPGDQAGPPAPPEQGRGGERDAVADGAGRRGDAPPSRVAARAPDRCAMEIKQAFSTAKPAAASSGPSHGGSGGRVSSPGRAAGHPHPHPYPGGIA